MTQAYQNVWNSYDLDGDEYKQFDRCNKNSKQKFTSLSSTVSSSFLSGLFFLTEECEGNWKSAWEFSTNDGAWGRSRSTLGRPTVGEGKSLSWVRSFVTSAWIAFGKISVAASTSSTEELELISMTDSAFCSSSLSLMAIGIGSSVLNIAVNK